MAVASEYHTPSLSYLCFRKLTDASYVYYLVAPTTSKMAPQAPAEQSIPTPISLSPSVRSSASSSFHTMIQHQIALY